MAKPTRVLLPKANRVIEAAKGLGLGQFTAEASTGSSDNCNTSSSGATRTWILFLALLEIEKGVTLIFVAESGGSVLSESEGLPTRLQRSKYMPACVRSNSLWSLISQILQDEAGGEKKDEAHKKTSDYGSSYQEIFKEKKVLNIDDGKPASSEECVSLQKAKEAKSNGLTRKKTALEDFDLLKVLGKGSFGKVYIYNPKLILCTFHSPSISLVILPKVLLVRQKSSGQLFALKILKKADVYKRNQIAHTNTEKNILSALQHPFIVKMYSSFQTDEKLYMCLEYVEGGELFVHLRRYRHPNNCLRKLPLMSSFVFRGTIQVALLPGTCGPVLRRGSDSGSGLSSPTRCGLQRLKGKQK